MAVIRHADERTLWSCMTCGAVGDRQSCHACGAEAMPGAWVPADQLAGAVEALREVERARHLEGKDAGTKADIMARIARDALHRHGGQ